jgi:hypothetical protein
VKPRFLIKAFCYLCNVTRNLAFADDALIGLLECGGKVL